MNGDGTPLEERLVRLSSAGIAGRSGKVMRGPGRDALLRRILREVESAVLPRRLVFAGADGRTVSLAAASGRLVAVVAAVGPGGRFDAFAGLSGEALDPSVPGLMERVQALLEALTEGIDRLSLLQEASSETPEPGRST